MPTKYALRINGQNVSVEAEPDASLLMILREQLDLTGTKYGCGEGQCGACTVLIDGRSLRSCLTPVSTISGKSIVTVEGLAKGDRLHPVQQAFLDEGAMQCAYCTSGMIMSAVSLLNTSRKSFGRRDSAIHAGQYLPLRNLSADCCGHTKSQRCRKGARPMTTKTDLAAGLEPERYELHSPVSVIFESDRRDFFKFLGAGFFIVCAAIQGDCVAGIRKRPAAIAKTICPRKSTRGCTSEKKARSRSSPGKSR